MRVHGIRWSAAGAVALAGLVLLPSHAGGFTQSGVHTFIGNAVPMGHEWITRLAALEVIGGDPLPPDPEDPRDSWGREGRAKNLDLSSPGAQAELAIIRADRNGEGRYRSVYSAVFDAIIGERWVDIGGFNVVKSKLGKHNCFDAVAQEPPEVQYDHFMRRFDDRAAVGGVTAVDRSQQRFIDYFVAAATAPRMKIRVWDGGGSSGTYDVDQNYFLFGRAVHLFEDSFSPEHTVRTPADNYERVRQVKSYLCASGAEQHSRASPTAFGYKNSGDVVWLEGTNFTRGWKSYKPSFMKSIALVATEATKDLWAAFIRSMGTPAAERAEVARREAETLVENWLRFDEQEMLQWYDNPCPAECSPPECVCHRDDTYVLAKGQEGKGVSVEACMAIIDPKNRWGGKQSNAVEALREEQLICLYNVQPSAGYADLFDAPMHMPFEWSWTGRKWQTPPSDWQPPEGPAATGRRVRIRSTDAERYLTAAAGLRKGSKVRTGPADSALRLVLVTEGQKVYLRSAASPGLFLGSRRRIARLSASAKSSAFRLEPKGEAYAIYDPRRGAYLWRDGEVVRVDKRGDPDDPNAQWLAEEF